MVDVLGKLFNILGLDRTKRQGSDEGKYSRTTMGLLQALANKLEPPRLTKPKYKYVETGEAHVHIFHINPAGKDGRKLVKQGVPRELEDSEGNKYPNPAWVKIKRTPLKYRLTLPRGRYDGDTLRAIRADGKHR